MKLQFCQLSSLYLQVQGNMIDYDKLWISISSTQLWKQQDHAGSKIHQ